MLLIYALMLMEFRWRARASGVHTCERVSPSERALSGIYESGDCAGVIEHDRGCRDTGALIAYKCLRTDSA
jgi:hypothetical protein